MGHFPGVRVLCSTNRSGLRDWKKVMRQTALAEEKNISHSKSLKRVDKTNVPKSAFSKLSMLTRQDFCITICINYAKHPRGSHVRRGAHIPLCIILKL